MSKLHASPSLALDEKLVCISGQEVDKYDRTATMDFENMSCSPTELFVEDKVTEKTQRRQQRPSTKIIHFYTSNRYWGGKSLGLDEGNGRPVCR